MAALLKYIQVVGIITACLFLALIHADLKNQHINPAQVNTIISELNSINLLLENAKTPERRTVSHAINAIPAIPAAKMPSNVFEENIELTMTDKELITGNLKSGLFMLEYTDYQCPFCQRFHSSAFKSIEKDFIDTGKIIYISRDFPLSNHAYARTSAIAARCAGAQNKFWQYRPILFENQAKLEHKDLLNYAQKIALNIPDFDKCLNKNTYSEAIDMDIKSAEQVGINGTPTIILGRVNGKTLKGIKLSGAFNYEVYKSKLEELAKD